MRIVFRHPSSTHNEIFMDLKRYENFNFCTFQIMVYSQPMPSLCELELELDDVSPLSTYWMIVKFIVVYPGTDIETFEVNKCCKEDGVVYLKKDDEYGDKVAQFSKKDNEVWGFLFHYSDDIYFKNFMDCKPKDINGREPYYWETYRGGIWWLR